jgi:hypothetical protein
MDTIRLTAVLLAGAFALAFLVTTTQAQRPPRGGGVVTPPPSPTPFASQR